MIIVLGMMLDAKDSILVLHRLSRDLHWDPGRPQLLNVPEEDLVAFELGVSPGWMVGDYAITVELLGEQQFANSNIDRDQDSSKLASLDVNLTVRGNIVEVSDSESRLHYLLGIEQCVSRPLGRVLGASTLGHFLEVENLI